MQKTEVNLLYWKYKKASGNFGDELSVFIVECLLNLEKYKLVLNHPQTDSPTQLNLAAIGSYIGGHLKQNTYIFGSGVRTLPVKKFKALNVCCVRGPLTQQKLQEKNPHINIPNIYGDPALLLPLYYEPILVNELCHKIGVVPHFSNYDAYKKMKLDEKFYLINPTNKWKTVINEICSCKSIISSSLHGLICSDAYNKPNIWLDEFELDEGDFKFKDYFESQERTYKKITNLEEYNEMLLCTKGNTIDLNMLVEAFPFK